MENGAPVVGPDAPTANSKMVKLNIATADWSRQEPPGEGSEVGRRSPCSPGQRSAVCRALSGRRERTDRNVISVQISERELLGLSVRIHVWLLFESSDEKACPLERQVEIIDGGNGVKSRSLINRFMRNAKSG